MISCNENIVQPETENTYFPLLKGNIWYYRDYQTRNDSTIFTNQDKEYDIRFEVIGNKEINGKDYYVVEERYYLNLISQPVDTSYYRTESGSLFKLKRDFLSNEYIGGLLAKFSLAEGDTFHYYRYGYLYIATILQKTSESLKIYYDIPEGADEEFELTFQKNIGLENDYSTAWRHGYKLEKVELK